MIPRPAPERYVQWALARHVAGIVVVMAAVGGAVLWQGHRLATQEADDAAAATVRTTALDLVVPLTRVDLSSADGPGVESLSERVDPWLAANERASVHLWQRRAAGTAEIVWSSEPAAVGFVERSADPVRVLGTTDIVVERVEEGDHPGRELTEPLYVAYAGFTDRSGLAFALEVCRPVHGYAQMRSDLLADWLPVALGGVLVLGLATLPLSVVLARRVTAGERVRRQVSHDALMAASTEHRRMAEALHERSIQDLAAVAILIDALREEGLSPRAHDLVRRMADIIDAEVEHLRELLDRGHDHGSQHDDLEAALRCWPQQIGLAADRVTLVVDPGLGLDVVAVEIVHRVAKELMRNVAKHAAGARVVVTVSRRGDALDLSVQDDGPGFDPSRPPGTGLRLARAAIESWGGRFDVRSSPGAGARAVASVPLRSAGRGAPPKGWKIGRELW